MRSVRLSVVFCAVIALLLAPSPLAAQEDRWSVTAGIGPSFANVGTTLAANGSFNTRLTERVNLIGEFGALPHAPFDRAEKIAAELPGVVPATDFRVNSYHFNANLQFRPSTGQRFTPYVTAGLGTFTSDTVGTGRLLDARVMERQRDTDFATNVGAGVTYQLTDRIGLNGDYRTFLIHRSATQHVHRFTTGLTFQLW